MALLAEQLVDEWLNRNGFFTLRGIKSGVHEIGFDVAQSTVSKYMVQRRKPPSQSWKTFLLNHADVVASIDMCVVPTVTFERLFAFLILSHGRRQLLWFEVTRHPTAT